MGSSGGLINDRWNVTDSYGRSSPYLNNAYLSACQVGSNGGVNGYDDGWGVYNSYGISLCQEKNIYRSPIISFNNSYAYLVELDGLVFNYNWDFGNSCGYF